MGKEQADQGYLKIGHNVNFGYYDQGQLLLDENETVLGEMKNAYHLYTDTEMVDSGTVPVPWGMMCLSRFAACPAARRQSFPC